MRQQVWRERKWRLAPRWRAGGAHNFGPDDQQVWGDLPSSFIPSPVFMD
jgi:hypothetical protein